MLQVGRIKAALIRLWAKAQQAVEQNIGAITLLYLLNVFTIVWHHLYLYQGQQLDVLAIYAVFLLAAVTLYSILLGLLPSRPLRRGLLYASLFISALLGALECFSIYNYRALVGAGIITAVLQTNPHEAEEFWQKYVGFTGVFLSAFFALGCVLLWRLVRHWRLSFPSRRLRSRLLPSFLALGAGMGIWLLYSYQSFIVNADLDVSFVRVSRSAQVALSNMRSYEELRTQAATEPEITENRSTVPYVVFILGESTARKRLHLYGYPLDNTPNLDELDRQGELAVFRDVIAPQGATAAVLRELFTFADAENTKDGEGWYKHNNLVDIMGRAGYRTYWLSNQESSGIWGSVSQFFAERSEISRYTQLRESHEESGRLDEELFPLVDEALAQGAGKNFYVLHLMGAHSLYYLRFPYIFTKFTAADVPPPQDELSEDKRTEIAQYENAIFYNDFVVSSLIGKFRDKEALVIYLPDHGEALYEHGSVSGHVEEAPNAEMLEVPLIFWGSPSFRERHPEKWAALQGAVERPYMTDDMIHTLLDILDIRTPEWEAGKSVVNEAFDAGRARIVQGRDYRSLSR